MEVQMESRAAEKSRRRKRLAKTERHVRRQLETRAIVGARNSLYGVGVEAGPTKWRNTPGWFKKNRWQRHRCGKSRRGRPKIGYGACHIHGTREACKERLRLRQELRQDVAFHER
jgi:hypothetical protein